MLHIQAGEQTGTGPNRKLGDLHAFRWHAITFLASVHPGGDTHPRPTVVLAGAGLALFVLILRPLVLVLGLSCLLSWLPSLLLSMRRQVD